MLFFLQLIAMGIFILIGVTIWNGMKRGRLTQDSPPAGLDHGDGADLSPGQHAAETLREFQTVQAELKKAYPAVFAMLGGYLNSHSINSAGGLEAAVQEMITDWTPRKDEINRELTKLLADNVTEEEARAVVMAACDAEFDQEGYRAWLTWLFGKFA
ncbi:MAG: hypothetical protein AAFY84_16845 [Pseudomonadota bacterium]